MINTRQSVNRRHEPHPYWHLADGHWLADPAEAGIGWLAVCSDVVKHRSGYPRPSLALTYAKYYSYE
ncbi:hypothetical protein CHELA1G11_14523 [Hyphomicrobiales bacterium]|nr:hypothetical protein CHELA1G11_14523 [Hyphomicrobiales bacterium]CAH1679708.1 hypothetical protein CHELA1G2_14587 [Hyphomicrobiales bacterium]